MVGGEDGAQQHERAEERACRLPAERPSPPAREWIGDPDGARALLEPSVSVRVGNVEESEGIPGTYLLSNL